MKIIKLHEISATKGYNLELNSEQKWLIEIFQTLIPDYKLDHDSIKGELKLYKTNALVNMVGHINYTFHPLCVRCCKEIKWTQKIQFQANFAPEPIEEKSISKDEKEEELELTTDDLNFGFYKNDEIQIDTIINDEIALGLPYNFYCQDKASCQLEIPKDEHITVNEKDAIARWLPLKNLKKYKN